MAVATAPCLQGAPERHSWLPEEERSYILSAGRRRNPCRQAWLVDLDLEQFFDRVNHDVLMARVARRVSDVDPPPYAEPHVPWCERAARGTLRRTRWLADPFWSFASAERWNFVLAFEAGGIAVRADPDFADGAAVRRPVFGGRRVGRGASAEHQDSEESDNDMSSFAVHGA